MDHCIYEFRSSLKKTFLIFWEPPLRHITLLLQLHHQFSSNQKKDKVLLKQKYVDELILLNNIIKIIKHQDHPLLCYVCDILLSIVVHHFQLQVA